MKNKTNIAVICVFAACVALGCSQATNRSPQEQQTNVATVTSSAVNAKSADAKTTKPQTTQSPSNQVSSIQWKDYDKVYNLKSNSTDIQKQELWKNFEGKYVAWSGQVTEIQEGMISGLTVGVKFNSDSISSDVLLSLKPEQKSQVASYTKGSTISFVGKLKSYGGILPASIDDVTINNGK